MPNFREHSSRLVRMNLHSPFPTKMKTGVFTCWCGERCFRPPARTVDCEKVSEEVARIGGVYCSVNKHPYKEQ
ncbi:MAG TPA: hypothetical protein DEB39_09275 [Planctomycetaceae bacterium]|nr:hypothetical protein [Planctomycetaceae bacterium]